jgi:hypothetical protein
MATEKPKQATGAKPQATDAKPQATDAKPQATDAKPQATGAKGFAFETRIGTTLDHLKEKMETEEGWVCILHTEQGIRDFFKEQ